MPKDLDLKTPQLNQPIRVAVVGSTKSPSLGLTLSLIGKEVSIARIKKQLSLTIKKNNFYKNKLSLY